MPDDASLSLICCTHFRLTHQTKVCDMMCASVRQQMMLGVNDYLEIDRTQWMQNWPGQIVLNGSQVPFFFHRLAGYQFICRRLVQLIFRRLVPIILYLRYRFLSTIFDRYVWANYLPSACANFFFHRLAPIIVDGTCYVTTCMFHVVGL